MSNEQNSRSLPKWIREIKDIWDLDDGAQVGKDVKNLTEALTIAWEALEKEKDAGECLESTEEALRRIEELGNPNYVEQSKFMTDAERIKKQEELGK